MSLENDFHGTTALVPIRKHVSSAVGAALQPILGVFEVVIKGK